MPSLPEEVSARELVEKEDMGQELSLLIMSE